jgi:hydrogenase large subunit
VVQKMIGQWQRGTTFQNATFGSGWIDQLAAQPASGAFWRDLPIPPGTVQGWGGTEAPRGALMHQTTITGGKIKKYQCIVPTTWNGSPAKAAVSGSTSKRDHGAIEAATMGVPFSAAGGAYKKQGASGYTATQGGVEVLRAAQSFDPCIACAVH